MWVAGDNDWSEIDCHAVPASGARIRHLLPKVCYWLLTAVSKWATEQGIDGSEGAVRIEYGQPIRSLITVADIVGYAASSSRIRPRTHQPANQPAAAGTGAVHRWPTLASPCSSKRPTPGFSATASPLGRDTRRI